LRDVDPVFGCRNSQIFLALKMVEEAAFGEFSGFADVFDAYPLARKTDSAASRSADLDSCCATVIKLPENSDGDTIPTNRYADNHDHLCLDGS
jgi:hypothetical protein